MAEKLCIVCGKIPTNHPSGKCVMCMIEGKLPPEASQREIIAERFKIQDSKLKNNRGKKMKEKDYSHRRKCSIEDCHKYAVKNGMCTKCNNEAHGIKRREAKKEYKYTCEVEGCEKRHWKGKRCLVHWKEKHGIPKKKSQVSLQSPKKDRCQVSGISLKPKTRNLKPQPERIVMNVKDAGQASMTDRGNGKTACLAQLLYVSDLLDGQLNSAIENGIIDTKIIFDIRFRLGAVLRGSVDIPPAEART